MRERLLNAILLIETLCDDYGKAFGFTNITKLDTDIDINLDCKIIFTLYNNNYKLSWVQQNTL